MNALQISAMTLSCAAGSGLDAISRALREQTSGLRVNDFPGCELETWIGRVDQVEEVDLNGRFEAYRCRNNQLAALALEKDGFAAQVADLRKRLGASRIACVIGTSTAGIGATEQAYRKLDPDDTIAARFLLPRVHNPHTSTAFVAEMLGLDGPKLTVSTACSSSAKVFASAARLIEAGWADAAVVGGVDSLCLSVLYGFHSLELVSTAACRPFDQQRNGISLGEAAGFAVIERRPPHSLGCLLGWGETSDAHHMASPHPEGAGAIAAMRGALQHAGLDPEQVGYINCHGTATPMNDRIESGALHEVFGQPPPASSTKGWTGHALGAAGITEAIITLMALDSGELPVNLNCDNPDPESADFIIDRPCRTNPRIALTNSFGFGGSNCTLVLGRAT